MVICKTSILKGYSSITFFFLISIILWKKNLSSIHYDQNVQILQKRARVIDIYITTTAIHTNNL